MPVASTEQPRMSPASVRTVFEARSVLRSVKMTYLDELQKWQMKQLGLVTDTDYYHHTVKPQDSEWKDRPFLAMQTVQMFYSGATKRWYGIYGPADDLQEDGRKATKGFVDNKIDSGLGQDLLELGYQQVTNYLALNSAKTAPFPAVAQMSGTQQELYRRFLEKLGPEKPELMRETLRRMMPRWMWFPIAYPQDELTKTDDRKLKPIWTKFAQRDADFLISPEAQAQGAAPIHRVFETAKVMERSGEADLGFYARTLGVEQLLIMEQERLALSPGAEIPFFSYIFPGLMKGEIGRAPKRSYYDFSVAVSDTMRLAFARFQGELATGQQGRATHFLGGLGRFYPDLYPKILAAAIVNQGVASSGFNEVAVLRSFREDDRFKKVLEEAMALPNRRALTGEEIKGVAGRLPAGGSEIEVEGFVADVGTLLGRAEGYAFAVPLQKLGVGREFKGEVGVDVSAGEIEVKAMLGHEGVTRTVPFTIGPWGERESFEVERIDDTPMDESAVTAFRNLTATVIHNEAEKIRKSRRVEEPEWRDSTGVDAKPGPVIQSLNRAQRMGLYARHKNAVEKKRRRAGGEEVVDSAQPADSRYSLVEVDKKSRFNISGLEVENVRALLAEQNIQRISAERLIEKLEHIVTMAEVGGQPAFGKRVRMAAAEGYALTQVNWVLDGGTTQIRLYFHERGSGDHRFIGVMSKTGHNQQNEYIRTLMERLAEEGVKPLKS